MNSVVTAEDYQYEDRGLLENGVYGLWIEIDNGLDL